MKKRAGGSVCRSGGKRPPTHTPAPGQPPSRAILARIDAGLKPRWVPNRAAPPAEFHFSVKRKFGERILAIGDTHLPYCDQWRLGQVLRAISDLRPTVVVQMGDAYDFQNWSRYDTDRPGMTPEEELAAGYRQLYDLWQEVHRRAPRARKIQLKGNHCVRVLKHARRNAPKLEAVLELTGLPDLWVFPEFGVESPPDDRTIVEVEGIAFHHGHRMKLGDHMLQNLQHTVTGHTHRGGVFYRRFRGSVSLFELNAGYIADDNSPAMAYTPTNRAQSVPGFGWIDANGPRFYGL